MATAATAATAAARVEWGLLPSCYGLVQDLAFDERGLPTVQLAVHFATNARVAIKRVPCEELDRHQYAERLLHHITMSRTLQHPNLAQVHVAFITTAATTPARTSTGEPHRPGEVGQPECWVVQQLFERGSLSDLIKTSFPTGFDEAQSAYILREVLKGLEVLHVRGIVHRGITPRGVLIHTDGRVCLSRLHASVELDPNAMMHDFYEDPRLIPWVAPEMLRQDLTGYNSKIDIYSVGILALQLVNGRHPFAGQTNALMMLNKLQEPPPTLASVCPDYARRFSKHFATFIDACLQDVPEYRPTATRLLAHSFFKQVRRVPSLLVKVPSTNAGAADGAVAGGAAPPTFIARRRSSMQLLPTPGPMIKQIEVTYHAFPSLLVSSGLQPNRKGRAVQLDLGCDDDETERGGGGGGGDGLGRGSPVSQGSGHDVGRAWSEVAADSLHNGSNHSSADFMPREALHRRSLPASPVAGVLSPRSSPARFRRSTGSTNSSGQPADTPATHGSTRRFLGRHRRGQSMDNGRLNSYTTSSFDASMSSGGEGAEGYTSGAEGSTMSFRRRLRRRSRAVSMGSEEHQPAHAGVITELTRLWRSEEDGISQSPLLSSPKLAPVAKSPGDGDDMSAISMISSTPSDSLTATLSTTPRSVSGDTVGPSSVRSNGGFSFFRSVSARSPVQGQPVAPVAPAAQSPQFSSIGLASSASEPRMLLDAGTAQNMMPKSPVAVRLQPPSRETSNSSMAKLTPGGDAVDCEGNESDGSRSSVVIKDGDHSDDHGGDDSLRLTSSVA